LMSSGRTNPGSGQWRAGSSSLSQILTDAVCRQGK
jgi:hypothetical protein